MNLNKSNFSNNNFLGFLNPRPTHRTHWVFFQINCFFAGPAEVGVAAGGKADPLLQVCNAGYTLKLPEAVAKYVTS
jgi:hypothetical protein